MENREEDWKGEVGRKRGREEGEREERVGREGGREREGERARGREREGESRLNGCLFYCIFFSQIKL